VEDKALFGLDMLKFNSRHIECCGKCMEY
jgi:hypothetical protein